MKTVLSFILVLFLSTQILSQNLSFVKLNSEKYSDNYPKTGKVLHCPKETYDYGDNFSYSKDNGKNWDKISINDLVDKARNEFKSKTKTGFGYLDDCYSTFTSAVYNTKVILFLRGITFYDEFGDEYYKIEGAYSEDGISFKYVLPFELKDIYSFNILDDNHFYCSDLKSRAYTGSIKKSGKEISIDLAPVDLPVKENGFAVCSSGRIFINGGKNLYMSSDYGKTFSIIFTAAENVILQKVYTKNNYILIKTSENIVASSDKGKTFSSAPIIGMHSFPVMYKNKVYFIKQDEGLYELIVGKNKIEEKIITVKNTPTLSYGCTDLEEIDGKIILSDGQMDGYFAECYQKVFYELR
ncbi:MAG: hypothetical protein WAU11_16245 [Ignavibacteriaceae bacterium]